MSLVEKIHLCRSDNVFTLPVYAAFSLRWYFGCGGGDGMRGEGDPFTIFSDTFPASQKIRRIL